MRKDKTLLVLAGGIGSRFGGLKQIESVGPNGEFIIDYSIYDAIREGFKKVVFVIRKENYDLFKNTIGNRISEFIQVEYAFQNIEDIPSGYQVPIEREKMWGTCHAILAARNLIDTPFAVVNSDNFYGRNSIHLLASMLDNVPVQEVGLITYCLKDTLSENGAVRRGICKIKDRYLLDFVASQIDKDDEKVMIYPLNGTASYEASGDERTSVNLFILSSSIFSFLEQGFEEFMEKNKDDLSTCECLITDILQKLNQQGKIKIMAEKTNSIFREITYQSDLKSLKNMIVSKIEEGEYPKRLWKKYNN